MAEASAELAYHIDQLVVAADMAEAEVVAALEAAAEPYAAGPEAAYLEGAHNLLACHTGHIGVEVGPEARNRAHSADTAVAEAELAQNRAVAFGPKPAAAHTALVEIVASGAAVFVLDGHTRHILHSHSFFHLLFSSCS